MSDIGTEMNRSRKRQSSGSSQNSEQNPASPDSSGSVNYAFNQLNVSIPNDKIDDKSPTQPAKVIFNFYFVFKIILFGRGQG